MKATCPNCGCPLEYDATIAGDIVACPECQGKMQLPIPLANARQTAPPPIPAGATVVPPLSKRLTNDQANARFCPTCGSVTVNKGQPKGSDGVEVAIWILGFLTMFILLIPAIIYSVWRRSERVFPCDHCGAKSTIPAYSDEARARGIRVEEYTQPSK